MSKIADNFLSVQLYLAQIGHKNQAEHSVRPVSVSSRIYKEGWDF